MLPESPVLLAICVISTALSIKKPSDISDIAESPGITRVTRPSDTERRWFFFEASGLYSIRDVDSGLVISAQVFTAEAVILDRDDPFAQHSQFFFLDKNRLFYCTHFS